MPWGIAFGVCNCEVLASGASRVNPVFVDWGLAAAVTVATQLGVWLGSDAADHRLAAAVLAAVITVPIAVRRRFPLLVGVAVPSVSAVDHALWNPSSIGYPLATFLALYALAVWTRPRPFVVGRPWWWPLTSWPRPPRVGLCRAPSRS